MLDWACVISAYASTLEVSFGWCAWALVSVD